MARSAARIRLLICAAAIAVGLPLQAQGRRAERTEDNPLAVTPSIAAETFEVVWRTIRDTYYDPTFGGVDWNRARQELLPRAMASRNIRDLRLVLQQLVDRLGESHFRIWPPDTPPQAAARATQAQETGGFGLDVRLVEGQVVVTRVDVNGSAASAGVKVGWRLDSIDGLASRTLVDSTGANPRRRHKTSVQSVLAKLSGPPDGRSHLLFTDAANRRHPLEIARKPADSEPLTSFAIPGLRLEFEARRIRVHPFSEIGYIRFNVFAPPTVEKVAHALREFTAVRGMVIDLRGNRGGHGPSMLPIAGHFIGSADTLATMRARLGTAAYVVTPLREPGSPFLSMPLAILVDNLSASTAEVFAGGLSVAGRARVFGDTTLGAALPSYTAPLPSGDVLQYVVADLVLRDGRRIEGNGLAPHERVTLTLRSLAAGGDPVLDEATAWIAKMSDTPKQSP